MARFFFLDQSLKGIGGHHYDYAVHVLRAADQNGIDTILAANRSFRDTGAFPEQCQVHSLFRHTVYNRFTDFSPKRDRRPLFRASSNLTTDPYATTHSKWLRGRKRVIDAFHQDLHRLFAKQPHAPGDHVFLATISDVELAGLAEYLRQHDVSRSITWHCQFHFNIFDGRPHEYASQDERLAVCRYRFKEALKGLTGHDLRFYNTSQELAEQYQMLKVAPFESLAYPVNPELADPAKLPTQADPTDRPLRVTLAGSVRREKGQRELCDLIREINPSLATQNRVQFVVQRKRRFRWRRQQLDQVNQALKQAGYKMNDTLSFVDHPLDGPAYEKMIKSADIGLFLYDGRTYYARRAGVLGEFLSLGVPVIVPAGCWLSEQIRDVNESFRRHVASSAAPLAHTASKRSACLSSDPSMIGETDFDVARVLEAQSVRLDEDEVIECRIKLSQPCSTIAIECQIGTPSCSPGFVRCELVDDQPAPDVAGILRGNLDQLVSLHLPVPSSSDTVTLRLTSAFGENGLSIERLEFKAIESNDQPLGVVGMVAADRHQVPRLLQEVQTHYAHYRRTAVSFAKEWYASHEPKQVMRQLLKSRPEMRRAA